MNDVFRIVKLLQQQEAGSLDDAGRKELEAWMEKEENQTQTRKEKKGTERK